MIRRKGERLYVKWKVYDSSFNSWIDEKDLMWFYWLQFYCTCLKTLVVLVALQRIKISKYFPKPLKGFGRNINVKVDLSNYATKTDIKIISHVYTSGFALKTNLSGFKTEVDKSDIDKLVPVPIDLRKLSNVVKKDLVKKNCIW